MQKTLTKEQLAAQLDGCEYRNGIPDELIQAAKENKLVIVTGESDDLVEFRGAINEEVGATVSVLLSRKGIPESDCDEGDKCTYYQRWLKTALKCGEVREIRIFWGGECGHETMDAAKYAELGKPTWCFETSLPHAIFAMYDTYGDDKEYFCRGIVLDLDEIFSRNYTAIVMEQGGHES